MSVVGIDGCRSGWVAVALTRESDALAPKILEVERWLPSAPCPVHEVHPEVSFTVLLGNPAAPKKQAELEPSPR